MKSISYINTLLQRAISNHQAGEFMKAEKLYHNVIREDPHNLNAQRLLGGLYLQWKKPHLAIAHLEIAHQVTPYCLEILTHLGVANCQTGKSEEAIAYYKQILAIDEHHPEAVPNLAHLFFELGWYKEAIPWLLKALSLKPPSNSEKHSILHQRLAEAYKEQKLWEKALIHYEAINHTYPNDISALLNRGNILRHIGKFDEACSLYKTVVEHSPHDTQIILNYGTLLHDTHRPHEALKQYDLVLNIAPQSTEALISKAGLLMEQEKPKEAMTLYNEALILKPQSLDAKWGKSLALLALGNYNEGWQLYETGFDRKNTRGNIPFNKAHWNGAPLVNKRLLIWGEQGLGDVLQFIRYAQLCNTQGIRVWVLCHSSLVRLLMNCPYIENVVTVANENDFDNHIPVMSLPNIFKTVLETIPTSIPYFFTSQQAQEKWARACFKTHELKIGLVWSGNPRRHSTDAHIVDQRRSIPLKSFVPLIRQTKARFFSLQMGDARHDIEKEGLQNEIIDIMTDVDDFMDTAALIENLDLIISVDTSIVHLAGGLGKPVWILSRFGGCWRWLGNKENSPWYPSAKIFGQNASYDWGLVINNVRANLQQLITSAHDNKPK